MGKKRERENADATIHSQDPDDRENEQNEGSEDEDMSDMVVDVSFEWFNFAPEIDFHGTKSLIRQLFSVDASLVDPSGLTDLILSQPTIGSTVKVDGKDTDPYAILSVLNMHEHRENEAMKQTVAYIAEKARTNSSLSPISDVIKAGGQIGLIISERLINIPPTVGVAMYGLLMDEMEAAVEDNEPYTFTHYIILSRVFHEIESTLDAKRRKSKKAREEQETYYFHPEDEVFHKYASAYGNFTFTREHEAPSDSKRAFQDAGILAVGHMMLLEGSKLGSAVEEMHSKFKAE